MQFIDELLNKLQRGEVDKSFAVSEIEKLYGYSDIGVAKIDDYRQKRTGINEFIFGHSKPKETLSRIIFHYIQKKQDCLITKVDDTKIDYLKKKHPQIHFSKRAKMVWVRFEKREKKTHPIAIVTAGTSDLPIAMESFITLAFLGYSPSLITDIGVSAIHRLLSQKEKLKTFKMIICLAGMEAALPTVLGGLTGRPIIAVPTSTGYGISQGGYSTLFSMLSSCSPNISCVNIDNGFGAACFVHSVLNAVIAN